MKKFLFLLGLFLVTGVFYFCISRHAQMIQRDIEMRVMNTFIADGLLEGFGLIVDGRDVTLMGSVDGDDIKAHADWLARSVTGVRLIDNQIKVIAPLPEPPIEDAGFVGGDAAETAADIETDLDIAAQADAEAEVESAVEGEPEVEVEVEVATEVEVEKEVAAEKVPEILETSTCEAQFSALIEAEKIRFDSGQETIKSESFALLDRIAAAAKECEDVVIQVHGHTDSSGDKDKNRLLSLGRARSVGRRLITQGVPQEIRAFGHGSSEPIATNVTPEGRAQNRRIEFKVQKKEN